MTLFNFIIGSRRGGLRETQDIYIVLEREGFLPLLKKYPSPSIGAPLHIRHRGHVYTYRYIRHVYFLGLFLRHLRSQLPEKGIVMDIGCSYGIFSSLLKQEMPATHHVLVDLPEHLILAHYYLGKLFPDAKICGLDEAERFQCIDRRVIEKYDFVLVPTTLYGRLAGYSVDLAINFISFLEMSREWFFTYINSDPFTTASYLFTVNRFDAAPTYQNGLSFLDFPYNRYEPIWAKRCPFLRFYYESFLFFGYRQVEYPSQFFEFMGKRKP